MHWEYSTKPNLTKFGFVYCITNIKTKQAYIGCKQYFNYKKGKKKAESNWKSYMGSSKHLLEDIDKLGKENFKFVIANVISFWQEDVVSSITIRSKTVWNIEFGFAIFYQF